MWCYHHTCFVLHTTDIPTHTYCVQSHHPLHHCHNEQLLTIITFIITVIIIITVIVIIVRQTAQKSLSKNVCSNARMLKAKIYKVLTNLTVPFKEKERKRCTLSVNSSSVIRDKSELCDRLLAFGWQ